MIDAKQIVRRVDRVSCIAVGKRHVIQAALAAPETAVRSGRWRRRPSRYGSVRQTAVRESCGGTSATVRVFVTYSIPSVTVVEHADISLPASCDFDNTSRQAPQMLSPPSAHSDGNRDSMLASDLHNGFVLASANIVSVDADSVTTRTGVLSGCVVTVWPPLLVASLGIHEGIRTAISLRIRFGSTAAY